MISSEYLAAIDQNDKAHRKTLVQEAEAGNLTQERFTAISKEAKMWLHELFCIHATTKQGGEALKQ